MQGLFGSIAAEVKAAETLRWGRIDELWRSLFGGAASKAGPSVNHSTALKVTTFLACLRRIAEGNSTVPVRLFQTIDGPRKRREAVEHPLYQLLDSGPNEWQDSLQFRELLAIWAAAAGNAYAFKSYVNRQLDELIPIVPTHVTVLRDMQTMGPAYRVFAPDGTYEDMGPGEILHIRGLSWDGLAGLDIVNLLREPLGLALATEQSHAMLHANGARPSGVITVNRNLDETNLVRLSAWVKKHYAGLDNAARLMVLDGDAKFTPFEMKGVDSEHLATRKHEIEAICHGMGVLPIVIGYPADVAARAAAETLLAMHLAHTIRPWHRRFEKAFNRQLLTKEERAEGYYTKFLDGEFLRATAKDRAAYNTAALGGTQNPGWASINDVRGWDDMDEFEGGDAIYAPKPEPDDEPPPEDPENE